MMTPGRARRASANSPVRSRTITGTFCLSSSWTRTIPVKLFPAPLLPRTQTCLRSVLVGIFRRGGSRPCNPTSESTPPSRRKGRLVSGTVGRHMTNYWRGIINRLHPWDDILFLDLQRDCHLYGHLESDSCYLSTLSG